MFIALEGVEGSGKSTLAKLLAQRIKENLNVEVVLTREPGGTLVGQEIRKLLLERKDLKLSSLAETLLKLETVDGPQVEKVMSGEVIA